MMTSHHHRVSPRTQGPCDDRVEAYPDEGLFVLVDASGPTYGGYYRPVGVAPGLEALVRAWAEAKADPFAAMHKALALANAAMHRAGGSWNDDARRFIEQGEGELVHPTASMTAVALAGEHWVTGHVGSNAAWLVRQGYAERLATPHTLWQQLVDEGRRREAEPWQTQVVTRLLGHGVAADPDVRIVDAEPGDVIVGCSDGLWQSLAEHRFESLVRGGLRGEALIDELMEYGDPLRDRAVLVLESSRSR